MGDADFNHNQFKRYILDKNFNRYDFYIEKADEKANFLLAFSGALCVGLLSQIDTLFSKIPHLTAFYIPFLIVITISVLLLGATAFFACHVLFPRAPLSRSPQSVFYFNDVRQHKENLSRYLDLLDQDETKLIEDMASQNIALASICSEKMSNVKNATRCLIGAVIVIFVFLIAILTKQSFYSNEIRSKYNEAIAIEESGATLHYSLARQYAQNGDSDSAIDELEKTIQLDKRFIEIIKEEQWFKSLKDSKQFRELTAKEN